MKVAQRFYLREVVSGLVLTAGNFFRNMGQHIAHALGRLEHGTLDELGAVVSGCARDAFGIGLVVMTAIALGAFGRLSAGRLRGAIALVVIP